jgi:hypothetical protein
LNLQADAVLVHLTRTQVYVEGAEARPAGSDSVIHAGLSSVPVVYHQLLNTRGICVGPSAWFLQLH